MGEAFNARWHMTQCPDAPSARKGRPGDRGAIVSHSVARKRICIGTRQGEHILSKTSRGIDPFFCRDRNGNGLKQRPCIGVKGSPVDPVARCQLHDMTQIHDGDPVAHEADHVQVVGNEQVRELEISVGCLSTGSRSGACMDTSRADKGSSATIRAGFRARALAILYAVVALQ
jgi:hypothetical protein